MKKKSSTKKKQRPEEEVGQTPPQQSMTVTSPVEDFDEDQVQEAANSRDGVGVTESAAAAKEQIRLGGSMSQQLKVIKKKTAVKPFQVQLRKINKASRAATPQQTDEESKKDEGQDSSKANAKREMVENLISNLDNIENEAYPTSS